MSEYTKTLEKIFFLNDKNVISSLNDTTVPLNPVTSQKVTQNVYNKLNTQDIFISSEVNRLCGEISVSIDNLCVDITDNIKQTYKFVNDNFAHISGDEFNNLSVQNTLQTTTLITHQSGKETIDPHSTDFNVGIDGIHLSVHGNDRSITINTDNQLQINNKDLSSYLAETAESAYISGKEYTLSAIDSINYTDEEQPYCYVSKVNQINGVIEVIRKRPTSADIDLLPNYIAHEIKLSNDALSTEVSAQMYRSATDLSNYINQRVSIVYRPMGSVLNYEDLELSVRSKWTDAQSCHIGEVWNVINGRQEQPDLSGQNYVFVNQGSTTSPQYGWDNIGGWVDFHQFYTKDQTNSLIDSVSGSIVSEIDRDFVRQDGSDSINHLSINNGLTAQTGYFEEIHENLDEYTKLSVGSQGFTLDIDGSRSIDINVPKGYDGITVNGETISSFVESKVSAYEGGVSQIIAGTNILISPGSGKGVVTIHSIGGQEKGNYFDLDKNNTVSTETTFNNNVYVDFTKFKDFTGRRLSDIVSVENNFASLYTSIANIKTECQLDSIDFKLSSPLSTAFNAINKIAIDPKIDVYITPLDINAAAIADGFNALCSIVLSAKYNVNNRSITDEFKKIDNRFNIMEQSIAEMNLRLSAIEQLFKTYTFVVDTKK